MSLYLIANGAAPTTAAQAVFSLTTAIETVVQVRSTNVIRVCEWGVSFDGFASAAPVKCELLSTGTVFATVTAHSDTSITRYHNQAGALPAAAGLTLSTTGTGYDASAEGTVTATDHYDFQLVSPTNQYVKQFPLGREPEVAIGDALRIRLTAAAAVGVYAYILIEL